MLLSSRMTPSGSKKGLLEIKTHLKKKTHLEQTKKSFFNPKGPILKPLKILFKPNNAFWKPGMVFLKQKCFGKIDLLKPKGAVLRQKISFGEKNQS